MMTGIAIVGAGHWGPHLIRNFSDHCDSTVLWVVEQDENRRKIIADRFRSIRITSKLDDVLNDRRVDAVVISTPTVTHYEIAKAALRAQKHVLVEKPLTNRADAAMELCQLADAKGVVLMVGHVFLFNPAVQAARNLIVSGEIGNVRYISMTRTNLGPVRSDVNAAWDLAAHDISIANYWLDAAPLSASAMGGCWVNGLLEDAVFITLRYPADVLVHIEASWLSPRKTRLIDVVGDQKMLTVDDMDLVEPVRIYDKGIVGGEKVDSVTDTFAGFRAQVREGGVTIPPIVGGEPLRCECEAFLARVRGSADELSDGWTGLKVVRVLEAVEASLRQRGAEVAVERDP